MKTSSIEFFSVQEAATALGRSPAQIYYLFSTGKLTKLTDGKHTRVRRDQVESLLQEKQSCSRQPKSSVPAAASPAPPPTAGRPSKPAAAPTPPSEPGGVPPAGAPALEAQIPTEKKIKISNIVFDETLQVRASINKSTVADYAERMKEGERFPSVQLFADGDRHYIGDGWHRLLAASNLGYMTLPEGTSTGNGWSSKSSRITSKNSQ